MIKNKDKDGHVTFIESVIIVECFERGDGSQKHRNAPWLEGVELFLHFTKNL